MRKLGEWILDEDGDGYHCSECGRDICYVDFEREEFNYCPSCGKKMSELSPEDKLLRAGQTFIWKREKEFIDKSVLIKAIEEADCDVMADYGPEYGAEWGFSREAIKNIVQDCPTAEVAEVRHGRWMTMEYKYGENGREDEWIEKPAEQGDCAYCSLCNEFAGLNGEEEYVLSNFCPNCGAKMDGGNENE